MPPPFRLRQHDFKHIDAFLTELFWALMKEARRIVVTLNGCPYEVGWCELKPVLGAPGFSA